MSKYDVFDLTPHVTTLEQSQALKEAGIEQNSFFYWVPLSENNWMIMSMGDFQINNYPDKVSAFMLTELQKIVYDERFISQNDQEFQILTQSILSPRR